MGLTVQIARETAKQKATYGAGVGPFFVTMS